jgi:hypothetical protein
VNEEQLEAIVLRQRSVIAFAQAAWTQAQEENAQLRQTITELQTLLETHGISYEAAPLNSDDQLFLPFEAVTPRAE